MIPYFASRYECSQSGTRIVGVDCEQCRCRYFYELTRIGIGSATAPYGLWSGYAEISSKEQSAQELQARLIEEAELVPCPRCQWINEALVEGYRLSRYRWALPLGAGIAFFGTVAALIAVSFLQLGPPADRGAVPYVLIIGPAVSVVIGGLIVLVRNFLRSRIQPNHSFPAPPKLPAGVPPALLVHEATQTLHPVVCHEVSATGECEWFDFQIGRHRLPKCCSHCLNEASDKHVWTHPITVAVQLSVPRCADCKRRSRGVYLRAWCLAFPVSLAIGIGLLLIARLNDDFFWILAGCWVLICLAAAAFYASARSAPVSLRIVDRSRGILRLKFRNPGYRPETIWTAQSHTAGPD